jgi:hypothetical protein
MHVKKTNVCWELTDGGKKLSLLMRGQILKQRARNVKIQRHHWIQRCLFGLTSMGWIIWWCINSFSIVLRRAASGVELCSMFNHSHRSQIALFFCGATRAGSHWFVILRLYHTIPVTIHHDGLLSLEMRPRAAAVLRLMVGTIPGLRIDTRSSKWTPGVPPGVHGGTRECPPESTVDSGGGVK